MMGNISLRPQEKCENVETINSVMEKMRTHISIVDHAVTGLARAIDAMELNCQLIVKTRKETTGKEEAEQILQMIQDLILDSKSVMVTSVANFLNFVIENVKGFNGNEVSISTTPLEVTKYSPEAQEGTTKQDIIREYFVRRIDALKIENKMLQTRCDLKEEELNELHTRLQTYIEEIRIIKKRDNDERNQTCDTRNGDENSEYMEGNEHSQHGQLACASSPKVVNASTKSIELERENTADIKACTQNVKTYATENDGLIDQATSLHGKNQELFKQDEKTATLDNNSKEERDTSVKTLSYFTDPVYKQADTSSANSMQELQKLKEKYTKKNEGRTSLESEQELLKHPKTVVAQIYRYSRFSAFAAEGDILYQLNTLLLTTHNIKLDKTVCTKAADVPDDVIVIGCVNHSKETRKTKTVENFLKEFSGPLRRLAVIVYHQMNVKDAKKEVDEYEEVHNSVDCVVHVGCSEQGLSNSRLNKKSFDKLVQFILEKSVPETAV